MKTYKWSRKEIAKIFKGKGKTVIVSGDDVACFDNDVLEDMLLAKSDKPKSDRNINVPTKTNNHYVSTCCNCNVITLSGDEGTNCWICEGCNHACDVKSSKPDNATPEANNIPTVNNVFGRSKLSKPKSDRDNDVPMKEIPFCDYCGNQTVRAYEEIGSEIISVWSCYKCHAIWAIPVKGSLQK